MVPEDRETGGNREKAKMARAYSLYLSLFPPVKTCLRTGFLGIAGLDQRGLSKKLVKKTSCGFAIQRRVSTSSVLRLEAAATLLAAFVEPVEIALDRLELLAQLCQTGSFSLDHIRGSSLDETRVGQFLFFALDQSQQFCVLLLQASDFSGGIDQPGQIDEHVDVV